MNCHTSINKSDIESLEKFEHGQEIKSNQTAFIPEPLSNITLKDVAGMSEVKDKINREILMPLKRPDLFQAMHKKMETGYLFYGLPGTGKTMVAKAIANEIGATFFSVKASDIFGKYVGESERNIKELFDIARQYENSIIFFDEFETIAQKRDGENNSTSQSIVTELLAQINGTQTEGTKERNSLLLIAATNCPWMIDSALLRPGRFGTRFKIDLPNKEARKFLIMNSLSKVKYDLALDIEKIIECTEGFNGADISDNFIETMKSHSIDRAFKLNLSEAIITNEDLDYAIEHCKSSVSKEDIERLEEFEKSLN